MTIESESPQTPERPQTPGTPPPPPPPAGPPAVVAMQYPVNFDVEYQERYSRATTFFRGILLLPQAIIVGYVSYIAYLLGFYSVFTLLFAKRLPRESFRTQVWAQRWLANFSSYFLLLTDRHPPFTGETSSYPVHYDAVEAPELSRGLPLVKWLMVIPHLFVLQFLYIAALFCIVIAWFAILFVGRWPRGFFNFVVGVHRWQLRVNAYAIFMLTDRYPPFSFE